MRPELLYVPPPVWKDADDGEEGCVVVVFVRIQQVAKLLQVIKQLFCGLKIKMEHVNYNNCGRQCYKTYCGSISFNSIKKLKNSFLWCLNLHKDAQAVDAIIMQNILSSWPQGPGFWYFHMLSSLLSTCKTSPKLFIVTIGSLFKQQHFIALFLLKNGW